MTHYRSTRTWLGLVSTSSRDRAARLRVLVAAVGLAWLGAAYGRPRSICVSQSQRRQMTTLDRRNHHLTPPSVLQRIGYAIPDLAAAEQAAAFLRMLSTSVNCESRRACEC